MSLAERLARHRPAEAREAGRLVRDHKNQRRTPHHFERVDYAAKTSATTVVTGSIAQTTSVG